MAKCVRQAPSWRTGSVAGKEVNDGNGGAISKAANQDDEEDTR